MSTAPPTTSSALNRSTSATVHSRIVERIIRFIRNDKQKKLEFGDYLVEVDQQYGSDALNRATNEAAIATGETHGAIHQKFWVSQAFPPDHPWRSQSGITWSHLRALMGIKDKDEKQYWFDQTLQHRWGSTTLRERVNESKGKTPKGQVNFSCSACGKEIDKLGSFHYNPKDGSHGGDYCPPCCQSIIHALQSYSHLS
jgi:hypothetical protein